MRSRGSARSTTSGTPSTSPRGRLARERIEKQGGQRAEFLHEPDRYFDYFSGLLEPPAIRLTADITPGYAALSAERLTMIRAGFASRGVRPAAVYLLRDPVERIWSAARMDMRRRGDEAPRTRDPGQPHVRRDPMYADRTRYDLTMDALEEAFPREDVFYGFYERLFSAETLAPLCEFLGIDFHEPDTGPAGQRVAEVRGRRPARGHPPHHRPALRPGLRRRPAPLPRPRPGRALAVDAPV